jgi:hypothetical protein
VLSSSREGRGGEGRCRFVNVVVVVEPHFIKLHGRRCGGERGVGGQRRQLREARLRRPRRRRGGCREGYVVGRRCCRRAALVTASGRKGGGDETTTISEGEVVSSSLRGGRTGEGSFRLSSPSSRVGDDVGERGGRETLVDTSGRVRAMTSTIKIRLTLNNTLV